MRKLFPALLAATLLAAGLLAGCAGTTAPGATGRPPSSRSSARFAMARHSACA